MSADKGFEEWHLAQCKPYESDDHCPHKEWERVAWRAAWLASRKAALEEAAALAGSLTVFVGNNTPRRAEYYEIEDAILALKDQT